MAGSVPPPPSPPAQMPNAPQWMPSTPPTPMHAMRTLAPSMSFLLRVLGFTLLFIAALMVVAFAIPGGGCYPTAGSNSSCGPGSSFVTGAANAILAGHILFALGAFLLGLGAGLKMHFGLQASPTNQPEENRFIVADRWFNGFVFLLSVLILFWLLAGVGVVSL